MTKNEVIIYGISINYKKINNEDYNFFNRYS